MTPQEEWTPALDRLGTVLVLIGVYAGLCILGSLWLLLGNVSEALGEFLSLALASVVWLTAFVGLKRREAWGWWVALVSLGCLALLSASGLILLCASIVASGLGDRHGVGAVGQLILAVVLTGGALFFGYPAFLLIQVRKAVIQSASKVTYESDSLGPAEEKATRDEGNGK